MALSDEEIRRNLTEFAAAWGGYRGTERSGAQTFCNELLASYGTNVREVAEFESRTREGGFIDFIWPGVCLIEMKRPTEAERLEDHRKQALDYWTEVSRESAKKGVGAPEWIVVCAFQRFLVLDPDAGWDEPVDDIPLAELPERFAALKFLGGKEPYFRGSQADLSREAVGSLTDLYRALQDRDAADLDTLRSFILQVVWCMFAEDLDILKNDVLRRVLEGLIENPQRSSSEDLGQLFRYLADKEPRPTSELYSGTPYANGGLFEEPALVHLTVEEVTILREACDLDWRQVEPAIFGSILQGALGKDKQWALGAHYTSEADIMKVVGPTVVEPWRSRVEGCETVAQAEAAWRDLIGFAVLDPACGSGNFLYVAYRELRRIEARLRERLAELRAAQGIPAQEQLDFFPITNMHGIEVEVFAAELARVVLWMGHKLAADEMASLGINEPTLPLADLSAIRRADALRVEWPQADAIISNPPYHGSQMIRNQLGDAYVEFLKQEFKIGVKDYAVYWFRKAHERLGPGGRAGMVATNSVTQNQNRKPSLEWIVENSGVITNAISTQDWTGAAAVDVSIVNWVKDATGEPPGFVLDGVAVSSISPALRPPELDVSAAKRLPENAGRSFQGPIPVGDGFVLGPEEAHRLLALDDADYSKVVRPYLIGKDIAEDPGQAPRRWIIDFNQMSLENASTWPAAIQILERDVKPVRAQVRRKGHRERWWIFGEARPGMRRAIGTLNRYAAANAQGKRLLFAWVERDVCPSNLTNVFAFDDDYSIGVLCSRLHEAWARAQSSTLEDRLRYTPTSAFETYPWPTVSTEQREAIADVSRKLLEHRSSICMERGIGLTTLYNEVDEGAHQELSKLHLELDRAVVAAYGWPASVAEDREESNRRLLALNLAIASGEVEYKGPG